MLSAVKQKTFGREHSSRHSKYLFVIISPCNFIGFVLLFCKPTFAFLFKSTPILYVISYLFLLSLNVALKTLVNGLHISKTILLKHIKFTVVPALQAIHNHSLCNLVPVIQSAQLAYNQAGLPQLLDEMVFHVSLSLQTSSR